MTTCLSSERSRTSLIDEQEIETKTLLRSLRGFSFSLIEKDKGVVWPRTKVELRKELGLGLLNERRTQNVIFNASTTDVPNLKTNREQK